MANAPFRPLRGSTVSNVVCRALDRGGIAAPTKGANLLRHSAATAMLRGGATLDMAGTVLRHFSLDTTAHYAKVVVGRLRSPGREAHDAEPRSCTICGSAALYRVQVPRPEHLAEGASSPLPRRAATGLSSALVCSHGPHLRHPRSSAATAC